MDKKHKIYGGYWLQEDMLPQVDDRAIGLISNSLQYVSGIDTPENKVFVDAYAAKYKRMPSWFAESAYTAGLWTKTAIDSISGNVEDRAAFLKADAYGADQGPARTAQARRLRQSDSEYLHREGREDKTSRARRRPDQQADQDLRGGVAVLDLDAISLTKKQQNRQKKRTEHNKAKKKKEQKLKKKAKETQTQESKEKSRQTKYKE